MNILQYLNRFINRHLYAAENEALADDFLAQRDQLQVATFKLAAELAIERAFSQIDKKLLGASSNYSKRLADGIQAVLVDASDVKKPNGTTKKIIRQLEELLNPPVDVEIVDETPSDDSAGRSFVNS